MISYALFRKFASGFFSIPDHLLPASSGKYLTIRVGNQRMIRCSLPLYYDNKCPHCLVDAQICLLYNEGKSGSRSSSEL
ncbi:MAG: hypothetical protein UW95_C0001G0036 [Parcubacteria group bacterium GW2011_GWC1_45_14]|nr:MAG: hypothetical protein UW87_C0004G0014 [Candidatus Moranbacteria bacterium GW2011_GWC2_45_10]KKT95472.1 MAG: hypothetical protein UW95_C0001G0036 [Parcubacteria group bacterium GW2011_GWC1_45_14]